MSEKKIQFPSVRKGDPQNIIVLVGLWICAATVAIILIFNYSARRKSPAESKRTEAQTIVKQNHNHRYSHHSTSMYATVEMNNRHTKPDND
jgi:hypothetical protein